MWALALEALGCLERRLLAVEPAAGDGSLVQAAKRSGAALEVTAIELDPALLTALRETDAEVVHADALTLGRGPAPPSSLAKEFGALSPAEVPEKLLRGDWADVVVANPPYLRETGNRAVFTALRAWNHGALSGLYRKDCDLHHFFWDVAMRWLRPGGVLVFLTPAYFLESQAAAPLRDALLSRGHVMGVWRSREDGVFPRVAVEAAVTVWRKGHSCGPCSVLGAELTLDGTKSVRLHPGQPWWFSESEALASLEGIDVRLQDWFRVSEGVSTGANRLRRADANKVRGGVAGEGILVLSQEEADTLRSSPEFDRLVFRRLRAEGLPPQWVLRVRDGDFSRLDKVAEPQTPIEHHLLRFRPILESRAEIRRNPARSWYAAAWPRADVSIPGAIVTPKWAKRASFRAMEAASVPMTDYRILIPKSEQAAAESRRVVEWLNSAEMIPWFESRMKRKGKMIEFYGECLNQVPLRISG